jgi:hypothetical protein
MLAFRTALQSVSFVSCVQQSFGAGTIAMEERDGAVGALVLDPARGTSHGFCYTSTLYTVLCVCVVV